jgi:hypothetical protein
MRRNVALVAAFGVLLSGSGLAMREGLDRAGVGRPHTLLDRVGGLLRSLLSASRRSRGGFDVVMVGDSHLLRSGELPVHVWVERGLWEVQGDSAVWRVAVNGLSLFGHYCASDRIAETDPAAIVMELDLADLSQLWRDASDAPFAGLLAPRRWAEAAILPLAGAGVSIDQLLFYGGVVQLGGFQRWRWLQGEQARAALAPFDLGNTLQRHSPWPDGVRYDRQLQLAGLVRERALGHRRASPEWARATLGPALEGASERHPSLRFFESLLRHYAEAGVPVLVYVNPVNVEHLSELGLPIQGLTLTIERARVIALRQGAGFVDFHALLPDAAFRDEMDHLDADGDGARRLGNAIAESLLAFAPPAGSG